MIVCTRPASLRQLDFILLKSAKGVDVEEHQRLIIHRGDHIVDNEVNLSQENATQPPRCFDICRDFLA